MSIGLVVAVGMALAFAFTNGVHDAANAIATLVATRAARPGTAVLLAAVGNVVGPLVLGSAVANTNRGHRHGSFEPRRDRAMEDPDFNMNGGIGGPVPALKTYRTIGREMSRAT